MSNEKISDSKEALDEANNEFAFGTVLNAIPISHDADRTVNETASLLAEPMQQLLTSPKRNLGKH